MKAKKFYFDDDEMGLAVQTSHPNFNSIIKKDFYFDCVDDFAPFGNDDGADALMSLQDWYKEKRRGKVVNWLYRYIDGFGFRYKSKWVSGFTELDDIIWLEGEDPSFIGIMDRAIIGIGFGQCKITGFINPDLKKIVFAAIARQKLIHQYDREVNESGKALGLMDGATERDKQLINEWLERLVMMEADLSAFSEEPQVANA